MTGIVDVDSNRCFVLPLNRSKVLPPHSLFDLVTKMRNGYYDIDTELVRDVYRVITPAITNFRTLGYYIGRECAKFKTYRLERITSPGQFHILHIRICYLTITHIILCFIVYKRSADEMKNSLVFHEFAGVKINEIEILNLADIKSHN